MPDQIGNISVPEIVVSGVYPLTPDWGTVQVIEPAIATHEFGSANAKITQRFYQGDGVRRFRVVHQEIGRGEYEALRDFYDARKGGYGLFTFHFPEMDGATTAYTCYFDGPLLTAARPTNATVSVTVELAGVPASAPSYTLNGTDTMFPGATLEAALLAQVQEVIPLVRIQPKAAGYPAIYVSDRRCTVGGQLYQARLLGWSTLAQSMGGESDQATLAFGNADRVMRDLAGDANLWRAEVAIAFFHVGTGIAVERFRGYVTTFGGENADEFVLQASDGAYELTQMYPVRTISRTCHKRFDDGAACPYTSVGTPGFTSCDKSFAACEARGMTNYFGGINVRPQGVRIKDNGTGTWGFARSVINSTSLVADSIYGRPLQEVYCDADLVVNALIAAGREESDFYAAIGIVGAGPIGAYAADGLRHRLDGSVPHGPLPLGLRRSLGHDPVQNNDPDADSDQFSIDGGTFTGDRAAGVAFVQIRRTDPKGFQPTRVTEHEMQVVVSGGMGGWYWTDASTRAWASINTNPVWIAVNVYLRALGLESASAAAQVAVFDVEAAIAAAAICSDVVDVVVGSGTETQFKFRGVIGDRKPLRDWLQEILNNCLGYFTWSYGKLKIGIRMNSSAAEAFTAGNIVRESLQIEAAPPGFNELTVGFADAEFDYAENTVSLYDEVHRSEYGPLGKSLNLVGTYTKSQAARICTVRLREELGGISAAEWRARRRVKFQTTILALAVEPGMVISITDEDLPGGAGEFRVTRVVGPMPDWSMEIEGVTTADSMYDLAIGPKPADVTADAVPVEQVIDLVPGDVQPIAANDFEVVQSDDGINVYFDITYSPPGTDASDIGTFAGVRAWIEAPDASGQLFNTGDHDYNGDPDGVGAARYGTARLVLPLPVAGEDWRILLASRSLVYVKPVDLANTPSMVVTVGAQSLPGDPVAPPQVVEATLSASVAEFRTDLDGRQWAKVVISYTAPGGTPSDAYPGAWIYLDASGAPDPASTPAVDGSPWFATGMGLDIEFWLPRDGASQVYWARVTVNTSTYTVTPTASSPKVTFTIPAYGDAPQVTGFNVTVETSTRKGVPSGRYVFTFTKPVDPEYWYARIERIPTNSSFVPIGGTDYGLVAGEVNPGSQLDWWPLPTSAEYWKFRSRSVNQAGDPNDSSPPSVNVTVPASTGLHMASADTSSVGTGLAVSGGTLRVPDAGISTALIADLAVSSAKVQDAAIATAKLANLAVDNSKIAALAVDAAKLANSAVTSTKIASAAVGTAAIANLAVGSAQIADAAIVEAKIGSLAVTQAKIGNLAVGTAQILDLAVTSAKINDLSVAKLTAGTANFSGSVTFSASASLFLGGSSGVTISPGNLNATTINAQSAGQGWSITPGVAPTIGPVGTSLSTVNANQFQVASTQIVDGSRNANFVSLAIGGVSAIDSSRNGSFANVYVGSQFRVQNYAASGDPALSATHKVPVYDAFGSLLNYMFLYP